MLIYYIYFTVNEKLFNANDTANFITGFLHKNQQVTLDGTQVKFEKKKKDQKEFGTKKRGE